MTELDDRPQLPFPFSSVSNGEWSPPPPGPRQLEAVRRYHEEAARRARRLGMSRREFVRSAAGTALAFMVLSQVFGAPTHAAARPMRVKKEHCDDPELARELFEQEFFVMDVQLHHVDLSPFSPPVRAFIAQLVCGLRFLEPDLSCANRIDLLSQANFVKEVFVDSQTAVGVLSGVPNGIPLPVETMRETRDLVNGLAGSERALAQAMIDPTNEPGSQTALATLEHQVVDNGARAIKCYTGNGSWWLDDERVAYPMYEEALRLGLKVINVHKGFPGLLGQNDLYVRTRDLDKATRDWPKLEFVVYHSGYFPGGTGIRRFLADIQAMGKRKNLYAEIGSTFANVFLTGGPVAAAHLIGSLLLALGSKRILWGTDSIWWGSPQWQIDLFKALEIPAEMRERFGYPKLDEKAKQRILGRNAARLYGIRLKERRCELEADSIARLQREQGEVGRQRTHLVYGPQSPRQFAQLLAHEERRAAPA